ncbi:MAG: NACHT domain-containing protein, partial [Lachnospiraceae bacterium]|nr:NACHT domain-containing protein [Lachnospiraceae bacterium]
MQDIIKTGGTDRMEVIFSNVGCSILASIIYDISKVCLGKVTCKNAEHSIQKIEELMRAKLDDKYGDLYMSGVFQDFLRAPVFKDTIEHYTIYKITGKREGNICEVKKNNHIILEKDVIDFLVNYLFEQYSDEVSKPSKTLAYQFFNDFFIISEDYFVTLMKDEDKPAVFFVNEKMDLMQEHLLSKFGELAEIIKRMMKCDIVPVKNEYEDYVKEYHKILKANYSRAHVYLLDTIDFADFYVPPSLRRHTFGKEEEEKRWVIRQTVSKFFHIELENEKEDSLDDWKHIFDDNGIVYVTGGAGYGKSLFLKKLINDYSDMNILNSQEYLVIYGDLKAFYVEGEQPVSVVRFLQNSMVKETLMDEKHFPVEMIEYYIKTGRCLILLDALDEVEKRKREELHKRIIAYFKNQNPNNKICITSRNRGFIPEKDVEVFDILPLGRRQIEAYVDNIVKLGRFDLKDKRLFLEQTDIL